jgi:CO/xanthine dehydrogenase Mo-binding subunit
VVRAKEANVQKSLVGESVARVDARDKVRGAARYPQDFNMAGQLYGAVAWSAHPHARVLSIDTRAAEAAPGVVRVLTYRDVPVNRYGIFVYDQTVLVPERDKVRWLGDRLAIVVAETEDLARKAAALVHVEYELLPVVTDPRHAMREGAPLVHEELGTNVFSHIPVRKGDCEAAFARADVVIESTYATQVIEHAYLQPEAGIGYIDEQGRVAVIAASQWPHDDLRQLSHLLDLPQDRLRETVPAIGGAFGGREDMYIQHLLALCAYVLRRPVKMTFTREESMRYTGKRHPFFFRYKVGATRDGRLLAAEIDAVSDAGAHASTSGLVLGCSVTTMAGPYSIPNVRIDAYTVHTNNAVSMAMRGFGSAQACVAYEQHMDRLAEALGIDPVELRLKNMLETGSETALGNCMPEGTGFKQTLKEAALAAGWSLQEGRWVRPSVAAPSRPDRRRGIGLACAHKNVGFPCGFPDKAAAAVDLHLDESGEIEWAEVRVAAVDMGQGTHTVLQQMAAQALSLQLGQVRVAQVDTATAQDAGSASASRLTYIAGNALLGACRIATEKWQRVLRDETGENLVSAEHTYYALDKRPTTDFDPETGQCNPFYSYSFGAQVALVEVDVDTGEVEVLKLWAATDAGRVMNPQTTFGQVAGGVHMGVGWALMEQYIQQDGRPRTGRFSEYYFPSIRDMPAELISRNVEVPDPTGPFGAKGLGEITLVPTAPAILNAIHDAVQVRIPSLPATAEKVWQAMQQRTAGDNV